jgi:pimeloyl-ACP methyl ester carboxylesterase
MARGRRGNDLSWRRVPVQGADAEYGVAGDGPPVVFLHGWALAHRAYRRTLQQVVARGGSVYAPALPGFGGTPDLPPDDSTLAGYAGWVRDFVAAVGIEDPVVLVGHSFGGGVAIQVAHDAPDLVAQLVVVNSIGGSAWKEGAVVRSMGERPLWDWGLHLQADVMPLRQLTRVVPVIARDLVSNVARNPGALWRVGHIARTANLVAELEQLKRRGVPVVVVWGEQDRLLPRAALLSMQAVLGEAEVVTVPGSHNWLIADPDAFGEVLTNVVGFGGLVEEDEDDEDDEDEGVPDAVS